MANLEKFDITYIPEGGIRNENQAFISPVKILRYFDLHLMVGIKTDGNIKYIAIPFTVCNPETFSFLGPEAKAKFATRLCPDDKMYKEYAALKKGYTNPNR